MWDYWKTKSLSEKILEDTGCGKGGKWKSREAAGMGRAEVTSGHNVV